MKILVLGGTGAMGVPVVRILAERGNEVYVTTRGARTTSDTHIHYVQGDAHEEAFMKGLLEEKWDAIIDFMIYTMEEFPARSKWLMASTRQYVFLSSARVYADSPNVPITEESPRLLDTTKDAAYLATNEYALAKAREENVLFQGKEQNYTIIRPYITYNSNRLQLGVFEKEAWLQRALRGKQIVFSRNIASKRTTLTYGYDVALRIADLIGKEVAYGQCYQIMTGESILWEDVLEIYLDGLEEYFGGRPKVCMTEENDSHIEKRNHYQIHVDREYNRIFDNRKIQRDSGEEEAFCDVREGLLKCLKEFLDGTRNFLWVDWCEEGVLDRISGEWSKPGDIPGWKNRAKYYLYRFGILKS